MGGEGVGQGVASFPLHALLSAVLYSMIEHLQSALQPKLACCQVQAGAFPPPCPLNKLPAGVRFSHAVCMWTIHQLWQICKVQHTGGSHHCKNVFKRTGWNRKHERRSAGTAALLERLPQPVHV